MPIRYVCDSTRQCPDGWFCILGTCFTKEAIPERSIPKTDDEESDSPLDENVPPTYPIEVNLNPRPGPLRGKMY
ncbi:hypothetical protein QYM36_004678 [Artemia franciscana]|uniref:Uncharacterized protein n=1 Tax=Artemia franciscana TaxID=6661 RepID=A0AA88I3H7_ARTSF|nr:hypothetical protein QYM36_004678 [Artemia franciscana]